MNSNWVFKLTKNPKKGYCQYGESVIIDEIFKNIGVTNKFCVDFGAGSGFFLSNTRKLIDDGWNSLLMEGNINKDWGCEYDPNIKEEFVTAENINQLFRKYNVPKNFDLLSIDIDGNDLWVWKAIESDWAPRVVVIEFNGCIPCGISKTIEYNPEHIFQKNDYYGASFEALKKLGKEKGYILVYQLKETNMFFIREDLVDRQDFNVLYNHVQYHPRHPIDKRYKWVKY